MLSKTHVQVFNSSQLRGPVRGSIQKVRDELQRVGSEKLVAKVAEFESSLVEVEPDQRQIANLESRVAHQEVLQSSNDRLTADLAELRTSYWTISRPAIGTFHKNGSGEVSKAITFTRPMPVPPVLAPGLTPFCLSGFAYPFVLSHAKNIKKHGFDVSIVPRATPQAQPYTIWGELGSVSCSWLELGPDDLDFQCGQFDISGDTDGMSRKAQTDGKSLSHARTLSHH